MLRGPCSIPLLLKPGHDPVGALAFRVETLSSYTVCMKNFIVESGDFIATSGIYRMNDHPGFHENERAARGGPFFHSVWFLRTSG